MMAAMQSQLGQTAPDPSSNPAGTGASGHAMSLASGLIEAAHGDIPRGVLACYEDLACWLLECLCAVMRTYEVPYVLDANEELPPESPGSRRFVTQRYVLTERDIGRSYKLSATWRQKPDPTNITVTMDRATRGYASVVDVLEAAGETNSTYKIAEIIYYRAVMTPGTPENLELSAYVARKRGETEKAQQQELQAKGMLGPQGTPTDAIAPEAEQMAQAAAGGGNPPMGPSGIQTGVRSSIAATVQAPAGSGPPRPTPCRRPRWACGRRSPAPTARLRARAAGPSDAEATLPHSFADAYAATAQTLMRQVGDTMAAEAGPPTSVEVEGVTERQRAAGWNTAHPEATDAAMWQLAQRKYAEHAQAAAAGKMTPRTW
jgi:hypothetical protein